VPIEGSEFTMEFDNIIASIGQATDVPAQFGLELGRGNVIKVNSESMATNRQGVFAGGDIVTGPASVIGAIAQGRQAASSIDKYLGGNGIIDESLLTEEKPNPWFGQDVDFANRRQVSMPCIDNSKRLAGFIEVELGYDEATAIEEAGRCLRCDARLRLSSPISPPVRVKST
jgi:NADPH-dependent glutamate synthase beta subunit-like oxidoreductase